MDSATMRSARCALLLGATLLVACGDGAAEPEPAAERTWRMGFAANAPRLTIEDILATIDAWSPPRGRRHHARGRPLG